MGDSFLTGYDAGAAFARDAPIVGYAVWALLFYGGYRAFRWAVRADRAAAQRGAARR